MNTIYGKTSRVKLLLKCWLLLAAQRTYARTYELTFHSDYRETITDRVGIQLLRYTKILHFLSYKSYKITFLHELPPKLERLRRCRMVSRRALYFEWEGKRHTTDDRGTYSWQARRVMQVRGQWLLVGDVTWRQTWPPPLTSALCCTALLCRGGGATWVRYEQTSQRAY